MKNLTKVLGIAGITALSFLPMKDARGQNDIEKEILRMNKVENLENKSQLFLHDGLFWITSPKKCDEYSSNFKENLILGLKNSSRLLDSCINSLEEFTKYANNTGYYQYLRNFYSHESGEWLFLEERTLQIPLTYNKAKEMLPGLIEVKEMEKEIIKKAEILNLDNCDEINKFNLNLKTLKEKYYSCNSLMEKEMYGL